MAYSKKQLDEFEQARAELDIIMAGLLTEKKLKTSDKHLINVTASNRAKAQDPEWRERNQILSDKRWATKEHREKIAEANRLKAKDPKWLESNRIAAQKRASNIEYIEKQTEKNRKLAQDPEWRRKVKESAAIRNKKKRKPLMTPYGVFDSLIEASKALNFKSGPALGWYVKTKPTEYYYITREEYEQLKGKQ